jgi:hypothetical protein
MEKLGDNCNVVFGGILLEVAGKYGGGGGSKKQLTFPNYKLNIFTAALVK